MMLRTLLRLVIVIVLPVGLLLTVESYNPVHYIKNRILLNYFVNTYNGTFFLIDRDLAERPQSAWRDRVASLDNHFGYRLRLTPLAELLTQTQYGDTLREGGYVYAEADTDVLWRRVGDSDWVVEMVLDETDDEETLRSAKGTLFLLGDMFAKAPEAQWPQLLTQLQAEFRFPLEMLALAELDISAEKQEALMQKGYAWITTDDDETLFYYRIGDSDKVLSAGPTPSPGGVVLSYLVTVFAAILLATALGLLSWLTPLWRDLKRLDRTASEFGQGRLEHRVTLRKGSVAARLGRSFNAMADSIQKLVRSHQQLTNAVAHDLRTPLARLRFAVEILESEDCTAEEQERYRKSIHASIDSLDYLINQLLTHSRYSRAIDINHFSEIDLAALVEEEVDLHQPERSDLACEFVCDETLRGARIWADSRAIGRVLHNLLDNASRYAQSRVRVSLRCDGALCRLKVEDDGPGIPLAERETILQPFAQLGNAERASSGGHGLGLAIVSQIAQWHQGDVTVGDSPLGGAAIEVSWPARAPSAG
ncbi:ATP-binding protein [Hahella sp. NBU794]|uniref:ATP-binding protein n=1 Tax=Hahella sp. NBU794 TaxID=3422590 RepID=UPI003D6E80B0